MNSIKSIVIVIVISFTSPLKAVELKWKIDQEQEKTFHAIGEWDITNQFNQIGLPQWPGHFSEFAAFSEQLKNIKIPKEYYHYKLDLHMHKDSQAIRAKMAGIPVKFNSDPKNDMELELRERVSALQNAIMLQGDFDTVGNSSELTFYRTQKERNILTMFFQLPAGDISIGDEWSLPINLIETGPGIFVEDSTFNNKVKLINLISTSDGTIAEIQYRIEENIKGYIQRMPDKNKERPEFSFTVSSIGYGEFLVEKGYWKRQTYIISYSSTGASNLNNKYLFALELREKN